MMASFITDYWQLIVVISICAALLLMLRMLMPKHQMPYENRGQLITGPEKKFYRKLDDAVGKDVRIFAMVRIADLLKVKKGTKKAISWQNRINQKHVDFVLCAPDSLVPLMAIELDDISHQRADRILRDEFVNAAFDAAHLELLRIETQDEYDAGELRAAIAARISLE